MWFEFCCGVSSVNAVRACHLSIHNTVDQRCGNLRVFITALPSDWEHLSRWHSDSLIDTFLSFSFCCKSGKHEPHSKHNMNYETTSYPQFHINYGNIPEWLNIHIWIFQFSSHTFKEHIALFSSLFMAWVM